MNYTVSYDLYIHNLNYIRWCANAVGMDVMAPNYKPIWKTFVALVAVCVGLLGEFYSIWYFWTDVVKLMESAAIYALMIQGCTKFYTALRYHDFFIAMYGRLDRFHQEHRTHAKNNAALLLLMQRVYLLTRLIGVQYAISVTVFGCIPPLAYLVKGERMLCFSLVIPFTDTTILSHYFLNLAWQYYILLLALAGFSAAESVILLFVGSLAGYADVLKNEIDELNSILQDADRTGDRSMVKQKILKIICLHQRILEYEKDLEERYSLNNFVQVFSVMLTLGGALFLCIITNSITMYTVVLCVAIQLFELCLLGTILSVKNEEIEATVYNSLWYLMDRSEKSTFLILFHRSQHAVEMTVANMGSLNIVLFVTILRKIYGFTMMLMNFYG
ncbi:AGAP010505-PA-like protein [Anopheles sinensis]|uniref:AGAP010505-PA-like protein n=1 Tax=Anopheles sinensis TaxID=74873 RepID=A0A084WAK8_ANOSI|nr:AGAP010505-PA-like protein [Anopheles sinensis]